MARPHLDPGEYHFYKGTRTTKPASERKKAKGGKIMLTVKVTPAEYDQFREEAIRRKLTMTAVVRECLLAGICPE